MSRPRPKPSVPFPDKYAVRPGDLLTLRLNRSHALQDFVFGEACPEPHQFFEEIKGRHLRLARRNLEDYRLLSVWRDGALIAKVAEPTGSHGAAVILVPAHPKLTPTASPR